MYVVEAQHPRQIHAPQSVMMGSERQGKHAMMEITTMGTDALVIAKLLSQDINVQQQILMYAQRNAEMAKGLS